MPVPDPVESIGALLARVRTGSGRSELRLAELLCAASGTPTVSRHEVSRWEREQRLPSGYWLRWLAVVLDVPLDELERAAAMARRRRSPAAATPVTTAWTAEPGPLAARVHTLRTADDLVGGADLAHLVDGALAAAPRAEPGVLAELAQLATWVSAD